MRRFLPVALGLILAGCGDLSPDDAKKIAADDLEHTIDGPGPSLRGDILLSLLTVEPRAEGGYIVHLMENETNILWTVDVEGSGRSRVTRAYLGEGGTSGSN